MVAARSGVPTTRARRALLHALVAMVACGQVWCALELCGLTLGPPRFMFAIEGVVVLGATLRTREREPFEVARWGVIGLGTATVWAALYYAAAALTHPPAARVFDDSFLARLPLVPAFTSIYLGVHVFSVVPYCVIPEPRILRRYLLGNALIVSLSTIAWVALPVRLDRPPIPPDLPGFGAFLLRLVHQADPITNCFPSAHCSVSVYAAIGLRFAPRPLFAWGIFTAAAICASTIFIRQHYVADVAAGAGIAALIAYAITRRPRAR
ncbi:MAG: phosphatase PAP2 family protein [Labilithrix sp.]|nr:phosphatase PAP2 family protein [Labilithrix sp.]